MMSDLRESIREKVAEVTGRDVEELDDGMSLQEDLGVDSLKIMSLWQSVLSLLPRGVRVDQAELARIVDLGELCDAVERMSLAEIGADERPAYVSADDPGGRTLPMTLSQRFFLVSHQLVESTSLCSAVELDGGVDLRRLRTAWQALVARHVNLRTCFYVPPEARRLVDVEYRLLDDRVVPPVGVVDLGDAEDADAALEECFRRQLNRKWDIRGWPLHEVLCVRLPGGREALMLANEHLVSDGLGNQRLLGDLLRLYEDPAAELPAVLGTEDYVAAITAMNGWSDDDELDAYRDFVARTGERRTLWDPNGRFGKGREAVFRNLRYTLSREATAALEARVAAGEGSLYGVLLGSLARCLRERVAPTEADGRVLLQVPTAGTLYPEIELRHTVGCFAQNLSFDIDAAADADAAAATIGTELREALLHGHDRVQARLLADAMAEDFPLEDGLVPLYLLDQARQSLRGNLYAPFTGDSGLPETVAGLSVGDYRAGTRNVAGTVDVLHEIDRGRLCVFVNYDERCFEREQIERFVARHLERLHALAGVDGAARRGAAPAVREALAEFLGVPAASIDDEAAIDGFHGIDSLSRIRLVNAIGRRLGERRLARELVHCRSVAEMQAVVERRPVAASAVPAPTPPAADAVGDLVRLDPALPEIPLRHIEAQAARTPALEAVCNPRESISYAELDAAANRLAHTLIDNGVRRGDTVAMTCRRGPDMLVAVLGILKAGAAYVPLDTELPGERVTYIVDHARCRHWVGDVGIIAEAIASGTRPERVELLIGVNDIVVETGVARRLDRAGWSDDASDPALEISPDDLMVVLYTSGSTGRPKGVALNHRGYMNRLLWHHETFALRVGERVAQKTSCSFDVSVWELLWPLMCGGTVCAAERDLVTNPWSLLEWIVEQRIAVMHFVPSLFTEFVHAVCDERLELPRLRWLVFSGEALSVQSVRRWMLGQDRRIGLANLYGPTEASIDVTCHLIERVPEADQPRISIGKAIDNCAMLILDEDGRPIEREGVGGELCIAGVQLARGYLHAPGKTAEAFVPNTLRELGVPGTHIYRTGDVAEWLPGGEIDYRGRKDSQVKLRGFRIELGEVESVLCEHEAVAEAGARLIDDGPGGQPALIGWYAPSAAAPDEVREWLAGKLAPYMVPQRLFALASLPKNHNGKLDRKALVALRLHRDGAAECVAEPAVAEPAVATDVERAGSDATARPVSFVQRALLRGAAAFNPGASITRLEYRGPLDVDRLCASLDRVIARHPALRSRFLHRRGRWSRVPLAQVPPLEPIFFDARGMDDERFAEAFEQAAREAALSLDVRVWPLLALLIARRAPERYELAIVGSVLVGDMLSGAIVGRELWSGYFDDAAASAPAPAPVPDSSELDRALDAALGPEREALERWWREHLGETSCPLSIAEPREPSRCGNELDLSIERARLTRAETLALGEELGTRRDFSLHELIAAAIYRLAARRNGVDEVTIAHRVNGRGVLPDRIYVDAVDCFAYNFPLRMRLDASETLPECARRFRELFAEVPHRGASYHWLGERLPARLWPESSVADMRINFLGETRAPEDAPVRFVPLRGGARVVPESVRREVAVEFWISIDGGELELAAGSSAAVHASSELSGFLEALTAELRGFVQQCSERRVSDAA